MPILQQEKAEQMAELIRDLHARGWSPATSTNYSFRNDCKTIALSKSGIDKKMFHVEHFLLMDTQGNLLPEYQHLKPSAETLLHLALYRNNPNIEAVLHTHTVLNTVLSRKLEKEGKIVFTNYELLKAFAGTHTHEISLEIPIFPNTQDIAALSETFEKAYHNNPFMKGYLIAGHGFYTWGDSLAEAKRHLEAFEFLLECYYRELLLN